ncbi:MAG TPA: hypothetical protein VF867_01310 [Arthrobacter sp.]
MTIKPAHEPAGIPSGGQFAKTTHLEAALALPRAEKLELVSEAVLERRRFRQEQQVELDELIAVDSAKAIALHARAKFPTAAYISFRESNHYAYESEPWQILDAGRNPVASVREGTADLFYDWAGDREDEENMNILAIDLRRHGGRLDSAMTPYVPAGGLSPAKSADLFYDLDISKTLERTTK